MANKHDNAYALAGVDVDIEAKVSRIMYEAGKKTYKNRAGLIGEVVTPFDDFAGLRMSAISHLPEGSFVSIGFDTAGTKVDIAQRTGIHNTIAFDLLAMVCDDAVLRGGEPVLVGTTLETSGLGRDDTVMPIIEQLAEGYVAAAEAAGVAVVNGEIVQMGKMVSGYGTFAYHWGAACVWFGNKDRLLNGSEIKKGDAIVALKENGFRCNGWSLVQKTFADAYGKEWHTEKFENTTLGLAALTPSIIYARFIVGLHGGFEHAGKLRLHGVAHITGGGIPEKMTRTLRKCGLGARLDDLFEPAPIMAHCQRTGNISDSDAYGAWNMGQGMVLITGDADTVIAEAKQAGLDAKICGEIVDDSVVSIKSKGVEQPGKDLVINIA